MNKRFTYLIIIIAPFIIFMPDIIVGKSIFWGLPILQFYPWRELAFSQILNGQLPLWNPYNGLGTPLLANYQSALVYPFTWIIFIFYLISHLDGLIWGHLIINILHLSIAGIGILKIGEARKYSTQASVVSALSFSLGGYLLARFGFFSMIWAAAWFPWVFYYSGKAFNIGKFSIETAKLGVVITFLLLSGHAQLSWYTLIFSAIYLLFKFRKPIVAWLKAFSQFIIASMFAVGISAIQLLPTAELLLHSQRSTEVDMATSMTYSFWPWHFLNFINPHIFGHPITGDYWGYGAYWEDAVYIGILPLLFGLALIILMLRKRKITMWENSEIAFLGFMSIISIIFSLGNNTTIFPWMYKTIPSFDMFNSPARYILWLVFAISILAGVAFDHWVKPEKKTLYWVRLGTAGGFAIGLGALFMLLGGGDIKPTFIQATFEISVLMTTIGILYLVNPITKSENDIEKSGHIWKWVVVLFVFLDLCYMSVKHTPVQEISTVGVFAEKSEYTEETIYIPEQTDYEIRYNAVLNFDNFKNTISNEQLATSNLANVNIFSRIVSLNNFEPMRLSSYDKFITALNEKTSKGQEEILTNYGVSRYGKLDNNDPSEIFFEEIVSADKIQFFSNTIQTDSVDSMFTQLTTIPCVYILNETVNQSNQQISDCMPVDAHLSNLIWQGNEISFDLNISEDAWALISDTYDTGWHLNIDGNKAKLYEANGFIKAFEVPEGEHKIVLRYLPRSFIFGSLISLASLILMCILVYRLRKAKH